MKKKIIVFGAGILFGLIVLEAGLRLFGAFYSQFIREKSVYKEEAGTFVILCVGDSFTEGVGASREASYPALLERIFQKNHPELKVKVVNRGVGGSNSTMVQDRFGNDLNTVKPDLLVILAGGTNRWNVYGYNKYAQRVTATLGIEDFLNNFKLFRLVRLLCFELEEKKQMAEKEIIIDQNHEHLAEINELNLRVHKSNWEGRQDEVILLQERILDLNPNDMGALYYLGELYWSMGQKNKSRYFYQRGIEVDPGQYCLAFAEYADKFLLSSVPQQEDLDFINRYKGKNLFVDDILRSLSEKKYKNEISGWVAYHIKGMIREAKDRGVQVVLLNYPDYRGRLLSINIVLKEVARKGSDVFVDNDRIFTELFLKGERKEDYFAFDRSHCNAKGYGVMAQNVYDSIMDNDLVDKVQ